VVGAKTAFKADKEVLCLLGEVAVDAGDDVLQGVLIASRVCGEIGVS
jgi:hypothetical protein